jgi:hypothetical protein
MVIRCVDERNESLGNPEPKAEFRISPDGGSAHSVIEVQMIFPTVGSTYRFILMVDGVEVADWPFEVLEAKP